MKIVHSNPNVTNWNPETGYGTEVTDKDYPRRVFNAQLNAVLYVQLKSHERDLEYLCVSVKLNNNLLMYQNLNSWNVIFFLFFPFKRGSIHGFKAYLSTPGDSFKMSRYYLRVPFSERTNILIKPRLIITSEKLRDYKPNKRQCYFTTERQLRFFNIYSENNCKLECLTNYTESICGCVKFSMPSMSNSQLFHVLKCFRFQIFYWMHFIGAKGTRICGSAKIDCYKLAEEAIYGEDVIEGLPDENAKLFRKKCNCLSACTSIEYESYIDRANHDVIAALNSYQTASDQYLGWDWFYIIYCHSNWNCSQQWILFLRFFCSIFSMKLSTISITFKSHSVLTLKRSASYTNTVSYSKYFGSFQCCNGSVLEWNHNI